MCSSALLTSNVVPVAVEWYWSERLPGMGCKYKFLIVKLLTVTYHLIQPVRCCYEHQQLHDFYLEQ